MWDTGAHVSVTLGIYIQKQTSCLCIDERKRNQWWKKAETKVAYYFIKGLNYYYYINTSWVHHHTHPV